MLKLRFTSSVAYTFMFQYRGNLLQMFLSPGNSLLLLFAFSSIPYLAFGFGQS